MVFLASFFLAGFLFFALLGLRNGLRLVRRGESTSLRIIGACICGYHEDFIFINFFGDANVSFSRKLPGNGASVSH